MDRAVKQVSDVLQPGDLIRLEYLGKLVPESLAPEEEDVAEAEGEPAETATRGHGIPGNPDG